MTDDHTELLIEKIVARGFTIQTKGDRLRIVPSLPVDLRREVLAHRDEVWRAVHFREQLSKHPDKLSQYRCYCQAMWEVGELADGRSCLVWGVTPRGVIVLPYGGLALVPVAPEAVRLEPNGAVE